MDVLGSKGNEEKSIDTEIEVTTDNEDATEERSAELTTYFTNHTYIPSEVRMTVIIEKIKRTVHAYCTKIGSTGSFLKWKH